MPIGTSRQARIEFVSDARGLDRGLNAARSKLGYFGRSYKKAIGTVGSTLTKGLIAGPVAVAAAGTALFASQIDDALDYERAMVRLQIAQEKSTSEMERFRSSITKASGETGVARGELMRGVAAYQALTGDTKGATAAMSTFARVAKATGSSVDEIARAGASLAQNLKVDPADLEKAFSVLNVQGRQGAVELNEFAREVAELSASFQSFQGGAGISGVTEMGAALQIVMRNAGSASEAATSLDALMAALTAKAGKLKQAGIRVFDRKGEKRNFVAIMRDIEKAGIHETALRDILGRDEAIKAINAIKTNWRDFQQLVGTTDFSSIKKDMNTYLLSPTGKLETAMNNIKIALAEAFTPARIQTFANMLQSTIPIIERLLEKADRFSEWLDSERKHDPREKALTQREREFETGKLEPRMKQKTVSVFLPFVGRENIPLERQHIDLEGTFQAALDMARFHGSLAAERNRARANNSMDPTRLAKTLRLVVPPVVLKVDGNTMATSLAEAPGSRSRTGG